jgi:hypothetical protein
MVHGVHDVAKMTRLSKLINRLNAIPNKISADDFLGGKWQTDPNFYVGMQ